MSPEIPTIGTQVGEYITQDSYVITFWIIGLVVLGTLFWLSVLAIALLLCYKRRYREDAAYGYNYADRDNTDHMPAVVTKTNYQINDTVTHHAAPVISHHTTTYVETDTVKVKTNEAYPPKQLTESQTHSMVILDSPEQTPEASRKEYETRSASLKFNEESPEWESMGIQLRIDPSGKQEPIITRREHESAKDSGKFTKLTLLRIDFKFFRYINKAENKKR